MAFCGNCGAQVPDGTKFCPACGKPIIEARPQDPAAVQTAAPAQAPAMQQPVTPPPVARGPVVQQNKKSPLPLILGIAGAVIALIVVIVAIRNVFAGVAAANDKSTALSDMIYQAAYNRRYTKGGSSASGKEAKSGSESSGGDVAESKSDGTSSGSGGGDVQIADYASITGETYENGVFSVLVPDGWAAFPVKSTSGDGSIEEHKLNLVKGGTSDADLWSKCSIKIEVANYSASYSVYLDAFENYEDVTLPLGQYTYTGPAGEYQGDWECAMLSATNGEGYVAGSVFYKVKDEEISLSDADVQAILASVKVK